MHCNKLTQISFRVNSKLKNFTNSRVNPDIIPEIINFCLKMCLISFNFWYLAVKPVESGVVVL
jgi:hypothetical protein